MVKVNFHLLICLLILFLGGCSQVSTNPLNISHEQGDFVLKIEIDKDNIKEGENLKFKTYLVYVGEQEEIEITHSKPLVVIFENSSKKIIDIKQSKVLKKGEEYNYDGLREITLKKGQHTIKLEANFKFNNKEFEIPAEFIVNVI